MVNATLKLVRDEGRKAPNRINFTLDYLKSVKCPPGKGRSWLYDTRQNGLALMTTENGAKTYYCYRKVNGRPERIKLGKFGDITLENVRKAAAATLGDIAKGEDPMEKKRVARQTMTTAELWEHWLENYATGRLAPLTIADNTGRYNNWLSEFGTRKLYTIRQRDVVALHASIGQKAGPIAANRAIELLRQLFNYANKIGHQLENPVRNIDFYPERLRERFLQGDELPKFFTALEAQAPDFRDFFKICLFTGARRRNVQSMRWDEIDLERRTWSIPGVKAKEHQAITVHLAEPAVDILKTRLADQQTDRQTKIAKGKVKPDDPVCPWVFATRAASGHLEEPKTAWRRLLTAAGIEDLRLHDLRRSLGSWQAAQGTSLQIIGRSLGHRDLRSTEIYSRLNLDPVRDAVNSAVTAMVKAAKPEKQPKAKQNSGEATK